MTDIPDDIMKAASAAFDKITYHPDFADTIEGIALAILAERERCAKIAEGQIHVVFFDGVNQEEFTKRNRAMNGTARSIANQIRKGSTGGDV